MKAQFGVIPFVAADVPEMVVGYAPVAWTEPDRNSVRAIVLTNAQAGAAHAAIPTASAFGGAAGNASIAGFPHVPSHGLREKGRVPPHMKPAMPAIPAADELQISDLPGHPSSRVGAAVLQDARMHAVTGRRLVLIEGRNPRKSTSRQPTVGGKDEGDAEC